MSAAAPLPSSFPLSSPCRACDGTTGEMDPTNRYVRCAACRRSVAAGRREEELFYGAWPTEADAAAELDARVEQSGLFRSPPYREVRGYYLLFPSDKLRAAGWDEPVGIEIKRSGEPLGPALSQAIDYTYAAFAAGPYWVHLTKIFLWPLTPQSGAIESVMLQNGIGALHGDELHPLIFTLERHVIRSRTDGHVEVVASKTGRKVGSR